MFSPAFLFVALAIQLPAEPPAPTTVPGTGAGDINTCVLCHCSYEFFPGELARFHIDAQHLQEDVHFQRGVRCDQCHGGNSHSFDPTLAHVVAGTTPSTAAVVPFHKLAKTCAQCHESQAAALQQSVHAAGTRNGQQAAGSPDCKTCHGHRTHGILPMNDPNSPVALRNQVQACGRCHDEELQEYRHSPHGFGLFQAGLHSAACADCHGAHDIRRASDKLSHLHPTRVADTCATCHRFIQERLNQSVHGRGSGLGGATAEPAPGGDVKRRPSCTDCHVGHGLSDPKGETFRGELPSRCGNCHTELQTAYGMSMHGELSDLGYFAAADCADCHGAHDILALSDPRSKMAAGNRIATCAECHPYISAKLADFDPHANHQDPRRSPLVFWVYRGVLTFIIVVFGFFGLHSVLWFLRGLLDVLRHGRPPALTPFEPGFVRFAPFHRVAHTVMVISFLGLAATGLPLKFSSYPWAQWLAYWLGGFASTGLWHRIFSITTFGCFGAYMFLLVRCYFVRRRQGGGRLATIFGADSPVPNLRDARDFIGMVRWFFFLGPRPTFDRWAYWEKFDFFGATSDIILIGTSGLILWFPDLFCMFLPGEAVNVAKVVHSTLALLATGFVFAIHFFGTHFRPDKFPMDMSILTGVVSETEMHHERADWLARARVEGQLEQLRDVAPPRAKLYAVRIAGFIALIIGVALLVGIIVALTGVWPTARS